MTRGGRGTFRRGTSSRYGAEQTRTKAARYTTTPS